MIGTLLIKECKQILHSLVYYLFLLIFILFMITQLGENEVITKPQPGQESYGTKLSMDSREIMSETINNLIFEIEQNSFQTYPVGFYKEVILSQEDINSLMSIVENCTGKTWNKIIEEQSKQYDKYDTSNGNGSYMTSTSYMMELMDDVEYTYFVSEMKKVCKIIGSGSRYEQTAYENGVEIPMTYEDAIAEYQKICDVDGVTGSFMRLFCDYAGILLALLPVFLGVTRCVRDKRAKVDEVIYSKVASSSTIILSRYLANVIMIFLPVVILAFIIQTSYIYQAGTLGITPHYFAFLFYSIMWILPTILSVLAFSFLLTELLNGVLAIIIQIFWALYAVMSTFTLVGNFGFNLIPRWNTFGDTVKFIAEKNQLYTNRLLYTVMAVIIIILTSFIYGYKRKGGCVLNAKKY